MSLKFEGETLDAIRELRNRILVLEELVKQLQKQPKTDEVSEWLSKRKKSKYG